MPNAWAISTWASVSTLPKVMSPCRSAACSNTGPNWRHGPHHSAQKSTNTVPGASTTPVKFSVVNSTVAMGSPTPDGPWVFLPHYVPPGIVRMHQRAAYRSGGMTPGYVALHAVTKP